MSVIQLVLADTGSVHERSRIVEIHEVEVHPWLTVRQALQRARPDLSHRQINWRIVEALVPDPKMVGKFEVRLFRVAAHTRDDVVLGRYRQFGLKPVDLRTLVVLNYDRELAKHFPNAACWKNPKGPTSLWAGFYSAGGVTVADNGFAGFGGGWHFAGVPIS